MELLHLNESIMAPTFNEPALQLTIESYNTQIYPLTDLMVEIITFQLKEQALFSDFDMQASSLN